ncbi:MAG: NDP-sugar synthase [Bryobacteraceae bacterium]|nr:NDP-sugar synthase [Bryobacteraceae bacterium]
MKALILGAGRGTRVQPITYTVPKPMMPVLNRPIMELLVEHLRSHGVRQILVNTSYLAGEIENYFRDGSRFGVEIGYSFEGSMEDGDLVDAPVGSAGAIRKIQDHSGFFDEPFFVLCGDAIIDLDLTRFAEFHRSRGALASLAMLDVPREAVSSYGVVVAEPDGRILGFQEKPSPEEARSTTVNTGVYLFEPSVVDLIPSGAAYDIGGELFPDLVRRGAPFYALNLPFRWLDIGRVTDYFEVLRMAMLGNVPGVTPPGTEIRPGLRVGPNVSIRPDACTIRGPVSIGASATIEDGVTLLGPCYIGPGAVVEAGAVIEESFVFEYTRVGPMTYLKRSIANGRFCVTGEGVTVHVVESRLDWVLSDARAQHQMIADPHQMLDALIRLAEES